MNLIGSFDYLDDLHKEIKNMPRVTLNVVDSSTDPALNMARNTYPDHIPANSVWAMVDGIIA
jgi:hypothetical protein